MRSDLEYKTGGSVYALKSGGAAGDGWTISGYLTRWGELDGYNDITVKGSFLKTIAAHKTLPLLWSHEYKAMPIGLVRAMKEDDRGVFFIASLAQTSAGIDAYKLLALGGGMGVSYGFDLKRYEYRSVNGTRARMLQEVELAEVSLTPFPALPSAQITDIGAKDAVIIAAYELSKQARLPITAEMKRDYLEARKRRELDRERKLLEIELEIMDLSMK